MAVAVDQATLGPAAVQDSAGTSITYTTTIAAAAGATVFAFVTWYDGVGGAMTLSNVTGGGLTWGTPTQFKASNGANVAIVAAYAPAGLAISATLTANFSASVPAGRSLVACSFTGVKAVSPLDGTPPAGTSNNATAAAWATNAMSVQAGSLVFGFSMQITTNLTSTPTAPSQELFDYTSGVGGMGATAAYRIESTAGSVTVAGTWSANATQATIGVAYQAVTFPSIESSNPTADSDTGGAATSGSTAAASHTVVLPATVSPGSLLMMFGRVSTTGAVAITGGGWTIVQNSDASVGPDVAFWAYRNTLAVGTEGGTSVTVTHGTGTMAAQTRSIVDAMAPASRAPESALTTSVGETTTMDAPALAPAGGALNYLWLAAYSNEGASPALDKAPPVNYTLSDVDVRTGIAGNNWDNCGVKVVGRQLNAASEDPGTVALSVADNWMAYTIAVYPAGSGAATTPAVVAFNINAAPMIRQRV